VVFLNEEDRHLFLSYRLCNPWSSHVIEGEGIDITAFRPSPPPEEVVTVLYGGRMLWDKGVDTLVEASRLLKSRGVRARVILAGVPDKANPSSIPESKLQEWSNGGFVEWVGHQENMVNLVKLAHIACLASRREGVPTSLLEAAACGRPIIATDVPGCRDVVEHGYNGLLFPFGDAERLAACLENLINNPGLRTTLGQNSRQLAMDRFSIEVIAPKYLDIYSAMTRGGLPRQQVSIPPNPAAEAVRKIGSVPVPGPAAGKES
jgi:glycosyltransferase involved in cell wall biosynthesis